MLYALSLAFVAQITYDPLAPSDYKVPTSVATWHDEKRDRDVPVRFYFPESKMPAEVIIFSHGLGGSRDNNSFLGEHLAQRGYFVIFTQHPGSDESVWKGQRPAQIMPAMQRAANGQNLKLRAEDIPFVINQMEAENKRSGSPLYGRLNLKKIGMSGHSFGAVTTQAVSGQWYPVIGNGWNDSRITAATMYSPSVSQGSDPKKQFEGVKVPWLLMTGTKDEARVGGQTVEERLAVFPALPAGNKYELVLWEGLHSAFGDGNRSLPGETGERNPNHHVAMKAISTAFWDTYLKEDKLAKDWLVGKGPRSVLEEKDTWKKK